MVMTLSGNKNIEVNVKFTGLADGSKLLPYVILNCRTIPKEQLPRGITVRSQPTVWMTNSLMKYWVEVVWGTRPAVCLRKWGMCVGNI